MKINIDGPYREKRGLAQELRAYIMIAKIIAITAIILMGIATINYLDKVMTEQANLTYQVIVLQQEIDDLSDDILKIEDSISEVRKDSATLTGATLLGEYEITHYCPCSACCGKWADGITATGTTAKPNHTIAVDPEVIPYGTEVIIDGIIYIAEDCGGAIKGNRIDIFTESHSEAISRGVIVREVYVK